MFPKDSDLSLHPPRYFACTSLRRGLPGGSVVKNPPANAGDLGSIPGLGRSPGEGHGYPLQYACPEESHGQRTLVGYSPWGHKGVRHDLAAKEPAPLLGHLSHSASYNHKPRKGALSSSLLHCTLEAEDHTMFKSVVAPQD